ncbi:MAG: peptidoglycan DD-metalloendopeptidase family protein [Eubacterium sp.]|nr:peptidoglycan DD-metalloendopeptidase family protein [Eubacterium sp.]
MESQNDFISKLREIDDMIIKYQDKIDDIESRTSTAYEMMKELSDQVALAESQRDEQYQKLKDQIAQEYENGSYTYMDALFNATDYSDIVNKSEYIQSVDSYNNNILGQLTDAKRRLNDKSTLLASLTSDLKKLEEAYTNEQETLQILSDEKEKQVSMFQSSIETVKGELNKIERLEQEQSLRISSMEQSYRVSVSTGVSESGTKYAGGDFLWPCPSSTTITCPFGPREAPIEGASTNHKGMDIGCNTGANIVAAADGKVIHVGYMDINGNTIVIDHGSNISTVYAHLSGFAVNAGDTVQRGQTIGYAGSTGVSTGPHLHFAVRENGEYVNPLKYFSGFGGSGQ